MEPPSHTNRSWPHRAHTQHPIELVPSFFHEFHLALCRLFLLASPVLLRLAISIPPAPVIRPSAPSPAAPFLSKPLSCALLLHPGVSVTPVRAAFPSVPHAARSRHIRGGRHTVFSDDEEQLRAAAVARDCRLRQGRCILGVRAVAFLPPLRYRHMQT